MQVDLVNVNKCQRHKKRYLRESLSSRNQLRMKSERAVPKNITGQVGSSVYLHCIVETIGDKTVSTIIIIITGKKSVKKKNLMKEINKVIILFYFSFICDLFAFLQISWLRLRDYSLLTVGLDTHTLDKRFLVRHGTMQPNDWALQITFLSPQDEGIYECQVNSDPPRSQYYYLNVLSK